MTVADVAMLARMAVRLQPAQVTHRVRLRGQLLALRRWPQAGRRVLAGPDPAHAVGWPDDFVPVDARSAARLPGTRHLSSGRIELLGVSRCLGDPPTWQHADAPALWRFHLHYWDWAWGLAAEADRAAARAAFGRLWLSWQASVPFGSGDAWLPYPSALRAWSWCGLYGSLVAGTALDRRFVASLAAHLGFLRRHLELDVGGNHLVKDLKALIGLAVFFGDERLLRLSLGRLTSQLPVQVLADGGHYERAPAYHCQVLADLVDVAGLGAAAGLAPPPELAHAIAKMRDWLGHVLLPDGEVPLLNDGFPVRAELLAALRPGPGSPGPMTVLAASGLVRACVAGWHMLADVGAPCPRELPAHAQADTFGFLLHLDGVPLLVDTGTSTYAAGPGRRYERSTAAHSTVQVDDADSTEVWGAFRAGRRARVRDVVARASADGVTVHAVHDGFRRLRGRPLHWRRWTLDESGLRVDDEVAGVGRHVVTARWHLAPGTVVRLDAAVGPDAAVPGGADARAASSRAGAELRLGGPAGPGVRVRFSAACPLTLTLGSAPVAAGFARTAPAPVLTCRLEAALPVRLTSSFARIGRSSDDGGPQTR